jgi:hypothetical protein
MLQAKEDSKGSKLRRAKNGISSQLILSPDGAMLLAIDESTNRTP